jgi:hypothetical protein
MAEFINAELRGAVFDHCDLTGAQFRTVYLTGATFRGVNMSGAVIQGADLTGASIHADIEDMMINGVVVGPLIEAELNKRYPDRAKMRPSDVAGFLEAWDAIERLWGGTVQRARELPPGLLHEQVNGEWSFIETLRHLVFATDAWVRRGILGDPSPWDALDLPWDEMSEQPGVPRDREVRPSLDTMLELRRDRMSGVRTLIFSLADVSLDAQTKPMKGPGWPRDRSYRVRDCLQTVLIEEWEHRLYAERDLDILFGRVASSR